MISNPFEMVAIIVIAVMVAGVLKAKYGYGRHRNRDGSSGISAQEHAENLRLREEVKELKKK